MAIPNIAGMQRKPTYPGEMLREGFLPDYGLTVARLAESLGVSGQSVNELLRERRAVSPEVVVDEILREGRHGAQLLRSVISRLEV